MDRLYLEIVIFRLQISNSVWILVTQPSPLTMSKIDWIWQIQNAATILRHAVTSNSWTTNINTIWRGVIYSGTHSHSNCLWSRYLGQDDCWYYKHVNAMSSSGGLVQFFVSWLKLIYNCSIVSVVDSNANISHWVLEINLFQCESHILNHNNGLQTSTNICSVDIITSDIIEICSWLASFTI